MVLKENYTLSNGVQIPKLGLGTWFIDNDDVVQAVKDAVEIPVIAAGGIADGRGMLAAMTLGADAVQVGSRFVASVESSAHQNFKDLVVEANEGDTLLTLKELAPVRLLKNKFYDNVLEAYSSGAKVDQLRELLGKGRAKKGMFEGDLDEGELEIGQISGMIHEVKPASEIVKEILADFAEAQKNICKVNLLEATNSPK